eukprot:scpid63942/ scgid7414/ 
MPSNLKRELSGGAIGGNAGSGLQRSLSAIPATTSNHSTRVLPPSPSQQQLQPARSQDELTAAADSQNEPRYMFCGPQLRSQLSPSPSVMRALPETPLGSSPTRKRDFSSGADPLYSSVTVTDGTPAAPSTRVAVPAGKARSTTLGISGSASHSSITLTQGAGGRDDLTPKSPMGSAGESGYLRTVDPPYADVNSLYTRSGVSLGRQDGAGPGSRRLRETHSDIVGYPPKPVSTKHPEMLPPVPSDAYTSIDYTMRHVQETGDASEKFPTASSQPRPMQRVSSSPASLLGRPDTSDSNGPPAQSRGHDVYAKVSLKTRLITIKDAEANC